MRPVLLVLLGAVLAAPPSPAQVPSRLSPAEFGALSRRLSEPPGYFDTDNLVSNEDSYLHAITALARRGVQGGIYVGVGPDQNFSYIAAIRPRMAFILDIRRDNLREHLLFKALFKEAANRIEFLCLLFGKPIPADAAQWSGKSLSEMLDYISRAPPVIAAREQARARVNAAARQSGIPFTAGDIDAIRRFHDVFLTEGPALRLTTFDRPVRADYPTYGELMLQTDREGRRANYLARESDYQYVRSLQLANLIVPVVGDFGGSRALINIGAYIADRGERLSAFYTSNVEQYLFRDGSFPGFVRNIEMLPRDAKSVIVRSYFPYGRPHPLAVPEYLSVQLVQDANAFLAAARAGEYRTYRDLVNAPHLPPK